jgi:hypothetical protein
MRAMGAIQVWVSRSFLRVAKVEKLPGQSASILRNVPVPLRASTREHDHFLPRYARIAISNVANAIRFLTLSAVHYLNALIARSRQPGCMSPDGPCRPERLAATATAGPRPRRLPPLEAVTLKLAATA